MPDASLTITYLLAAFTIDTRHTVLEVLATAFFPTLPTLTSFY